MSPGAPNWQLMTGDPLLARGGSRGSVSQGCGTRRVSPTMGFPSIASFSVCVISKGNVANNKKPLLGSAGVSGMGRLHPLSPPHVAVVQILHACGTQRTRSLCRVPSVLLLCLLASCVPQLLSPLVSPSPVCGVPLALPYSRQSWDKPMGAAGRGAWDRLCARAVAGTVVALGMLQGCHQGPP